MDTSRASMSGPEEEATGRGKECCFARVIKALRPQRFDGERWVRFQAPCQLGKGAAIR